MRNIKVDYQPNLINIYTTGYDVGGNKDIYFIIFEVHHNRFSLGLLQVGVHGCYVEFFTF